jgi:hypothetical protein
MHTPFLRVFIINEYWFCQVLSLYQLKSSYSFSFLFCYVENYSDCNSNIKLIMHF